MKKLYFWKLIISHHTHDTYDETIHTMYDAIANTMIVI